MRFGWVVGMMLTQTLVCWVQTVAGGGGTDGTLDPQDFDCPCPIWAINFTKRRHFCGREFRGTTGTGCHPHSMYVCKDPPEVIDPDVEVFNTGEWQSWYDKKCQPGYFPEKFCGLDCKNKPKHPDNCYPSCFYSESEAKKSIDDIYNRKKPWERSRKAKGTRRRNRTKTKKH